MIRHRLIPISITVLVVTGVGSWAWSQDRQTFDHLKHQRMFPTCAGCHQIQSDAVTMPASTLCTACHDGNIAPQIEWDGPSPRASNLNFNHETVIEAKRSVLGMEFPCNSCHVPSGAERMDVQRAVLSGCLGCHAPGKQHFVDATCEKCHVPLTEAPEFTIQNIRNLPEPEDHAEGFLAEHGQLAENTTRCAVCHAQDFCRSCHVNASTVPTIQALGQDARVAEIAMGRERLAPETHDEAFAVEHGALAITATTQCAVCHAQEFCSSCHVNAESVPAIQQLAPHPEGPEFGRKRTVVYPTPASHGERDWLERHGPAAGSDGASCATCHAQPSCTSCHVAPLPEAIRRLPKPVSAIEDPDPVSPQQAQGVILARGAPASHTPGFADDHRAFAATTTVQCATCHTQDQCISCHTGSDALTAPGKRIAQYHPANFQQQHAAPAFSQAVECATCHNPEAFCRDCHNNQGFETSGRIATGFHAGKPTFVFGHGVAARQGLESCATCHAQRDCLLCHSGISGRRISPHGNDLDLQKLKEKNPVICLACHTTGILRP